MNEQSVKPEKITKPIQLLAAWLAGLFTIDSAFLFAATRMDSASWQSGALVIAAMVNVPLFLGAVFLLQTRFRPELQEDSYYSTYLSRRTNEPITLSKENVQIADMRQKVLELESRLLSATKVEGSNEHPLTKLRIGINKHLTDKNRISAKLSELGVLGFMSFGSDESPPHRSVAISEYLSPETVKDIVRFARELGFTHYTLFDNKAEETAEDVLLGSYGEALFEIAQKSV
jgi:hypothetical protein